MTFRSLGADDPTGGFWQDIRVEVVLPGKDGAERACNDIDLHMASEYLELYPTRNKARMAPGIGGGFVMLGARTSKFSRREIAKLGLIALGLVNIAAVHCGSGWKTVLEGGAPGPMLRLGASASLLVWIAAVVAGRWIGFL